MTRRRKQEMTSLRRFTRSQESLAHKSFFLKRKPVPLDGKVLRSNPPCHIRFRTIFTGVLRTWRSDENDGWKVGVEASPRFTWKLSGRWRAGHLAEKKKTCIYREPEGKKKTTAGRILLRGPSSSQQQIIWCRSFPVVRMLWCTPASVRSCDRYTEIPDCNVHPV